MHNGNQYPLQWLALFEWLVHETENVVIYQIYTDQKEKGREGICMKRSQHWSNTIKGM